MPDLLIELFSEEIPARMQSHAAEDLKARVTNGLVEAGLTYAHAGAFATPRRLTLALEGLPERSPDTREERKGPKLGAPDKAVEGFLRGAGVARDALQIRDDKKGQVYFAVIDRPGRPAAEIVAEVLEGVIRNFPWPKSMRWGGGSLRWVRPLHRIVVVLSREDGHEIVPLEIDGIKAGDATEGHRFMAPGEIRVTGFDDYAAKLRRAKVMLDPEERMSAIWNDATNAGFASGFEVVEDRALLAEVAGLVEWPVVLMGRIGDAYLDLPPEVLQTSMREHQKFFSVRDSKSGRITRFITVANRETSDDGATILAGNQRVLSARLADAAFFWENDLKVAREHKMQPWIDALATVTFHAQLGTEADRTQRIAALARDLAPAVGADPDMAEQAARLAKADLTSEMVYGFPELQGVMGRYYATEAGFPPEIATAIAEHYAPLGPSDTVPTAPVSVAVSLAEKIDKLAGFWAIDEKPTGSKDPYALRRAALGVIRLTLAYGLRIGFQHVVRKQIYDHRDGGRRLLRLVDQIEILDDAEDVSEVVRASDIDTGMRQVLLARMSDKALPKSEILGTLREQADAILTELSLTADDLLAFLHDRLKVHLRDEGVRHDVIDACLTTFDGTPSGATPGNDDLTLLVHRARALSDFLKTDDGENLLLGFRRANNILAQAEEQDGVEYSFGANAKFAEGPEERALFTALDAEGPKIETALKAEDFATAMSGLAALRAPLDAFFDAVQINTDTQILRRNRLNLISRIRALCLEVADLTRIEG